MGSQHHHQTKVALTNLKVHLQKNYCRKTLITILLLVLLVVLLEIVLSDVKSFFIVFSMLNHISIYTKEIAQHNKFEHNINIQHVQICEIQNGDLQEWHPISDMDLGNSCDISLHIIRWSLFLALHMGIPINGFNWQNNVRSLRTCYHIQNWTFAGYSWGDFWWIYSSIC